MNSERKSTIKNLFKGLTQTSVFDPDLTSDKGNEEMKNFSMKQLFNHATGKEPLSKQDLEQLKKQAKYSRFL
ncbi:hypothetical protein [Brevibacillus choshinensis]|uniref:Uncharacterized protein n=1 Tax=Brevibacillus choshinensis TaxID=54911 RepID=A0ABX7FTP7_BRECH|nr:hypothetical protein [Brevibacillus choshinensis]QRG69083.1 hypothetical protein JNE38_08080 [Brevibacillus choshinensis]